MDDRIVEDSCQLTDGLATGGRDRCERPFVGRRLHGKAQRQQQDVRRHMVGVSNESDRHPALDRFVAMFAPIIHILHRPNNMEGGEAEREQER